MFSSLGKLNIPDVVKGFIVAVLTAAVSTGVQMVQTGTVDFKTIGTAALAAACAYILKQLGTDENGKFLKKV